jgi:hypothetical protein
LYSWNSQYSIFKLIELVFHSSWKSFHELSFWIGESAPRLKFGYVFPPSFSPPLNCQLMSSVKHVEFRAFTLSLSRVKLICPWLPKDNLLGLRTRVCVCRSSSSEVFWSWIYVVFSLLILCLMFLQRRHSSYIKCVTIYPTFVCHRTLIGMCC